MMTSKIFGMAMMAQTKPIHNASVIFMHGSGGTGPMARDSLRMVLGQHLLFPHIRILYPTAPLRPYSLCGGEMLNVWFDRLDLSQHVPEDSLTIESMAEELNRLIDQEIKNGVKVDRILLGGFSMGSSMALQMGYCFRPDIGGIFVCSSFLNNGSKVYEVLDKSPSVRRPPLFMCHGDKDDMVDLAWGCTTFSELQKRGVSGYFHTIPNMDHSINKKQVMMLRDWILQMLPDEQ